MENTLFVCLYVSHGHTHTPIYNIYANHKRKQRKLNRLKKRPGSSRISALNIYQICTQMGWSESQQGCKKHPGEKQLPGVCPSCLRERLSQIQGHSINKKTYGGVADSYSSSPSVASSSTFVSPVYRRHHRRLSERTGSISFTVSVSQGLKKSKSVAFVTRNRAEEVAGSLKKKGGFWKKLLKSTGKRTKEAFMQPRIGSQRLE